MGQIMEKQFEVVRAISSYSKVTERLIAEISIGLTLEQLKTIFTPCEDDPLLYDAYPINQNQAMQLRQLDNTVRIDLEQFDCYLECCQAPTY
jgi:hypothetical protein